VHYCQSHPCTSSIASHSLLLNLAWCISPISLQRLLFAAEYLIVSCQTFFKISCNSLLASWGVPSLHSPSMRAVYVVISRRLLLSFISLKKFIYWLSLPTLQSPSINVLIIKVFILLWILIDLLSFVFSVILKESIY